MIYWSNLSLWNSIILDRICITAAKKLKCMSCSNLFGSFCFASTKPAIKILPINFFAKATICCGDFMELTIAPIKKLIKKAGAKRVSDDAAIELAKIMEQKAVEICVKADKLAKYSNRKTVMKKDIKLAAKE